MAIKFCECLSYSMEVKHPRFSFSQAAGRYQLQGQRSCSAINCLLLVPTAAETYYFQHQITKFKKKKKKWLVRMAFLSKGLCTYFSRNLRFIFAVPQAAHLRAGRGCREQTEAARVLVPSAGSIFFWHRCLHGEQSQPSLFGNWHLWQRACSSSFTC